MTDQIWINDITVLINKDNFDEFIPTKNMTYNKKLNSSDGQHIVFELNIE